MADDRDDAPARLDRRVAEAADAWLTDPRDAGVYARLVAAVTERRAALDAGPADAAGATGTDAGPERDAGRDAVPEPGPAADPDPAPDADHEADEDPEPLVPLRPVGADLVGDPRAVLDRLRRG